MKSEECQQDKVIIYYNCSWFQKTKSFRCWSGAVQQIAFQGVMYIYTLYILYIYEHIYLQLKHKKVQSPDIICLVCLGVK